MLQRAFQYGAGKPRSGYLLNSRYCKNQPLELVKEFYSCVYGIAKHMLQSYDLYEEEIPHFTHGKSTEQEEDET